MCGKRIGFCSPLSRPNQTFLSPYVVAELPSNLILRKVGPGILMPILLTVWGGYCNLAGLPTSKLAQ